MSLVTEEIKAQAEVFYGAEICREKVKALLAEAGMPNGIIPIANIQECGRVRETGFAWFKRKEKTEHRFSSSGKLVSYAPEVTCYVEHNKIKKLTGVKSKELGAVWISITEVYVKEPEKVTFKGPAGLFKTYPFSAYEVEAKEFDQDEKELNNAEEAKVEILSN